MNLTDIEYLKNKGYKEIEPDTFLKNNVLIELFKNDEILIQIDNEIKFNGQCKNIDTFYYIMTLIENNNE